MSAATFTLTLPDSREPCFNQSLGDAPLTGFAKSSCEAVNTPFGGKLLWVGNATCIIEFNGIRFMTDPNFLHQGDHVHLAPGVTAQRIKDPAFDYKNCPAVDFILLSHLHEDHFDNLVAEHICKSLPIISTPHGCTELKERGHTARFPLETWESVRILKGDAELTITSMPGKHTLGEIHPAHAALHHIPPVMGSLVTFKRGGGEKDYNLYISGDTLYYDELQEIHEKYPHINLALVHLGGTTVPVIRVMVTMDAVQGIKLICALQPEQVIPIHIDDYDAFESPLSDFVKEVEKAGWSDRVIYLNRGEEFTF
ncbi:metallo-hydrolase/oxidoreductase [Phanerochaete sordida]|uniref:Metallo-hydrolase/oxidoreductase n=1 Tax=Phanerochaete sordida TaxID=48140 RepID=A0A9P3G6S4_9APHY|nr:metallo-hydrolase/oxidoreductase [Phanerochaete sordida]